MKKVSKAAIRKMKNALKKEFPNDKMMQDLHFIRWLDHLKTEGMSVKEKIQYYNSAKNLFKTKPISD